ncbi:MAG: S8 family serine peptidase [Prevotella sp.]|nr:S8 family serine peptidase [Prevotella sp.]
MRRIFLTFTLAVFTLVGVAQSVDDGKLSITTQMFLNELNGKLEMNPSTQASQPAGNVVIGREAPKPDRMYAKPDTIDGKVYISCFVRLQDSDDTQDLEALGVVVQTKFINGLITALVPIDKIEEVATIGNVTRINVSPLMKPSTNEARKNTNTDDVLTWSDDARAEGLSHGYDGTGVLLAVIDDGIDFQHIAFKDKDGNSRIKRAYVYDGDSENEYLSISDDLTTDDTESDHGTHTCSTAGGSSVIINGSRVSVTDDHANATYGGMAPGADLYLAGVNGLADTYLSNAFANIISYADQQNLPVVVSNSWGSQIGPHDGTGDFADVINTYFGSSHPNHVCLFAASNDAGKSKDNEGGGYHVSATASSSNPLRSILRSNYYSDTDGGYLYYGVIANAWCRSTNVSSMGCKIHVLDASTGAVKTTINVNPSTSGAMVSGLSSYFNGTLYAFKDYVSSNKTQIMLYTSGLQTRSKTTTTQNGGTYYKSKYTLAVEFYPTNGSAIIDAWGGNYCYFTNHLTTSGYNWKAGSDDMTVSDEATYPNVISIGAYVSKNVIKDYNGTTHDYSNYFTVDDIAYFSSYATANESPTGLQYPWITAPGARIVSAVNHYSTDYTTGDYKEDRVNANTTNPYAAMDGTSMATPMAAGIVALWLQAAKEVNKQMTNDDIKEVMQQTAIKDSYVTSGPNASHFGNGKIDALAGIKYILGASGGPSIVATPAELSFEGYTNQTYTQTLNVKGLSLEGNITVTLKDLNHVYGINKTSITRQAAENGVDVTVTWTPTAAGENNAIITLSSQGAEDVDVKIHGTAQVATPAIIANVSELNFNGQVNQEYTQTFTVTGRFLSQNVSVTLNDANNVFSVSTNSIPVSAIEQGVEVTVTFNADREDTFTGSITLASQGAQSVAISLNGTATEGGTAADAYLNIANYQTIDDQGWRTSLVDHLYEYKEYKDDKVAWLTLPVYGALVGAKYAPESANFGSGHPQGWMDTNITSTSSVWGNPYSGGDQANWMGLFAEDSPYCGNDTYFTKANSRVLGNGSTKGTILYNATFYVSNVTAVRLLGYYGKSNSSRYPTYLKVYECTLNDDGSLTVSSTLVKNNEFSTYASTADLSADGLDAGKIYKVEVGTYRGYLYEVAFQTPLKEKLIGDVTRDGVTNITDVTALISIVLDDDRSQPFIWPAYDHDAADVNGDGIINITDVTILVDIVLGE